MIEKKYVVRKMAFVYLEFFLNNYRQEFPNHHLYQIITEFKSYGEYAVVILELDSCFWKEGDE